MLASSKVDASPIAIWNSLPLQVKSLLSIAMLDVWGGQAPTKNQMKKFRMEAEASLTTAGEGEHFGILSKIVCLLLLELSIPGDG